MEIFQDTFPISPRILRIDGESKFFLETFSLSLKIIEILNIKLVSVNLNKKVLLPVCSKTYHERKIGVNNLSFEIGLVWTLNISTDF